MGGGRESKRFIPFYCIHKMIIHIHIHLHVFGSFFCIIMKFERCVYVCMVYMLYVYGAVC